jgi:hypothetical protein
VVELEFETAGVRVHVGCLDPDVAALVSQVAAPMLATRPGEPRVTLTLGSRPEETPERAAARIVSSVDRAALARTPCLVVHAAVLAGPLGCVVLPARSGAGKSTLAGAAMQAGLTLFSDEAACFGTPLGRLTPHPRPLGLSGRSRRLLGLDSSDGSADEEAVAPSLLGQAAGPESRADCVVIAMLDRRPGGSAGLDELRPVDAMPALLSGCLNASATGAEGWAPADAWRYLSRLAHGPRVVRLRYDCPHEAALLLREQLVGG